MSKAKTRMIIAIVVAIIAAVGAAFVFDRYALSSTYARTPEKQVNILPTYEMYGGTYPRTDVEFQLNGNTLRGHVYGASNDRGLIIFRHGMFSKHQDYLPFITAMVDKGWRVFAYDAIGCGESDGDSMLGMSQSLIDVAAAVDYARASGLAEGMPVALWGHSWGGYGVAAALEKCPDVDACVTMSGFDTPMKILDYSTTKAYGVIGKLQYPLLWLNTAIDFGSEANRSASDAVLNSGVPTLVVQGKGDTTVPYRGVSILEALEGRQDAARGELVLKVLDEEGRNGHNDYFYSRECQAYLNECAAKLTALLEENDDDPNAAEVQEYLKGVDLKKANVADPALVDEVDAFLAAHMKKKS